MRLRILRLTLLLIFLHAACTAQIMLLDSYSPGYIYPDTFALAWKKLRENLGKEITVEFEVSMNAMFQDQEPFMDGLSGDTLVMMIFYPEYEEKGKAVGFTPKFTRSGKALYQYNDHAFIFTIRPRSEKVQALIGLLQTNYSVFNLQMLAEAYEEEKCIVNALYIMKRIIEKDSQKGWPLFFDFYKRTGSGLSFREGHGAVNR